MKKAVVAFLWVERLVNLVVEKGLVLDDFFFIPFMPLTCIAVTGELLEKFNF